MRFSPFLGLTFVALIASVILIALGTWQYQRLGWKTQLLADIETASTASPFQTLGAINAALDKGDPIDYRRVSLRADYARRLDQSVPEFHVFTTQEGKTLWRIFSPVKQGGLQVFTVQDIVPDTQKDTLRNPPDSVFIEGYVRRAQTPSRFAAKNTPAQNRWFSFNADPKAEDWAMVLDGPSVETRHYIDPAYIDTMPYNGPPLAPRIPDIANNHFDYMLTWFSFLIILWVIYAILHIRAGRLSLRQ